MDVSEIIQRLQLVPHPEEGGYFRETYRSRGSIATNSLPSAYGGERHYSTAIYYLLTAETFSAMHLLPGDEVFHFYLGDPVEMLQLHPDGTGQIVRLGNDLAAGDAPQVIVPGDTWQGSRLVPGGKFALLGTTMAPGFEFADYRHGSRQNLVHHYPQFAELIAALTHAVASD